MELLCGRKTFRRIGSCRRIPTSPHQPGPQCLQIYTGWCRALRNSIVADRLAWNTGHRLRPGDREAFCGAPPWNDLGGEQRAVGKPILFHDSAECPSIFHLINERNRVDPLANPLQVSVRSRRSKLDIGDRDQNSGNVASGRLSDPVSLGAGRNGPPCTMPASRGQLTVDLFLLFIQRLWRFCTSRFGS